MITTTSTFDDTDHQTCDVKDTTPPNSEVLKGSMGRRQFSANYKTNLEALMHVGRVFPFPIIGIDLDKES